LARTAKEGEPLAESPNRQSPKLPRPDDDAKEKDIININLAKLDETFEEAETKRTTKFGPALMIKTAGHLIAGWK
jgi:hypothetical protein